MIIAVQTECGRWRHAEIDCAQTWESPAKNAAFRYVYKRPPVDDEELKQKTHIVMPFSLSEETARILLTHCVAGN